MKSNVSKSPKIPEPTLGEVLMVMNEKFSFLQKEMKDSFTRVDKKLIQHDSLLHTLVERADNTDARIAEIKSAVGKTEAGLIRIEDKIDDLAVIVDKDSLTLVKHGKRITVLEQNILESV